MLLRTKMPLNKPKKRWMLGFTFIEKGPFLLLSMCFLPRIYDSHDLYDPKTQKEAKNIHYQQNDKKLKHGR